MTGQTAQPGCGYVLRPRTATFLNMSGSGPGVIERAAFDVVWFTEPPAAPAAASRVAASDKPFHIAAAKRAAETLRQKFEAHFLRTGERFEVTEAQKQRDAREARRAEVEGLRRLRAEAPAMLAAIRDLHFCLAQWVEIADDEDKRDRDDEALAAAEAIIARIEGTAS